LMEMRYREIRDNLKNIEPKKRRDAVAGNLERIRAIIANPDLSDIIIDPDALIEMRREYAFKQDPSLIEQEKDQREIYRAVRARAGELSATATKMLMYARMDDPLTEREFYETFPPEGTDHEKHNILKRLEAEDKRLMVREREKALAEKNEGLNMQAGERAARIERWIRH
jgi:hypothetical protein